MAKKTFTAKREKDARALVTPAARWVYEKILDGTIYPVESSRYRKQIDELKSVGLVKVGARVALTGGTLYKDGPRKDADILFYAIRGKEIDVSGLVDALEKIGVIVGCDYGWVQKAILAEDGRSIDLFFPERNYDRFPAADLSGEYV